MVEQNELSSPAVVDSHNKNVIYVLNNSQQSSSQQIIKLNKPGSMPPVAANSILKAHLTSDTDLLRKSMNESSIFNSPDTNLK
jgi:hypothetical protein